MPASPDTGPGTASGEIELPLAALLQRLRDDDAVSAYLVERGRSTLTGFFQFCRARALKGRLLPFTVQNLLLGPIQAQRGKERTFGRGQPVGLVVLAGRLVLDE